MPSRHKPLRPDSNQLTCASPFPVTNALSTFAITCPNSDTAGPACLEGFGDGFEYQARNCNLKIHAIAIKKRRGKVPLILTNCICDEMQLYEDELVQNEAKIACRSDEENRNGDPSMITVHQ